MENSMKNGKYGDNTNEAKKPNYKQLQCRERHE